MANYLAKKILNFYLIAVPYLLKTELKSLDHLRYKAPLRLRILGSLEKIYVRGFWFGRRSKHQQHLKLETATPVQWRSIMCKHNAG